MAVKQTSHLIPMCHPLMIQKCSVDFELDEENLEITAICTAKTEGQTGVEMEALTGVNVALLTIYDMCKAIDKSMELTDIHLVEKAEEKAGYIETRKNSMKDRFGREIDYLRISITDRCNLRCVYCMPENGVVQISHEEILTYDEITRISRCMTGLGIRKIKLTGGEPLIRKNCATLVRMLKELPGIEK